MYDGMNPDRYDECDADEFLAAVPAPGRPAPAAKLLLNLRVDVFALDMDDFQSDRWQANKIEWAEED